MSRAAQASIVTTGRTLRAQQVHNRPGGRSSIHGAAITCGNPSWTQQLKLHKATEAARFRTLIHEDGTTQCWRQPRLAPWEVPRK
jgi:hypothetical protein